MRTNGSGPPRPKLKRSIGLWMATALVVGNMVGSGVFLLPATVAGTAGPVSMLGWLFTGAGAVLLARGLEADALLLLTDVEAIEARHGTADAAAIERATPSELRALDLPTGSMGPKAEAAAWFVEATGGRAAIGSLRDARDVLEGTAGTTVVLATATAVHGVEQKES